MAPNGKEVNDQTKGPEDATAKPKRQKRHYKRRHLAKTIQLVPSLSHRRKSKSIC